MIHVVVLHHGVNGIPSEMELVRNALLKSNEDLLVFNAGVNTADQDVPWYIPTGALFLSKNSTQDGVRQCGKRLFQYVKNNVIENCNLSFVGYSFGGLVIRACIAELHASNYLTDNNIKLNTFITLGTPHLGISDLPDTTSVMAGLLLGDSGVDLRLANNELYNLAVSNYCVESLSLFERIICYGCESDMFVSISSSLIFFPKGDCDYKLKDYDEKSVVIHPPLEANMSPDLSFFNSFSTETMSMARQMYLALRNHRITSHVVSVPKSLNSHAILVGKPFDDPSGELSKPILHHLSNYFI